MPFSIITGLIAILLIVLGVLLYRGHTGLVHAYHRAHVRDHAGYGRAMGVATLTLAAFLAASALLAPAMDGQAGVLYAVGLVFAGLAVYAALAIRAQRRYNRA